jgi:penicillin-binding protein 2
MSILRNVEVELRRFRYRILVASVAVVVAFSLLAFRLAYLQIYRYEDLNDQAEGNRTAIVPIVPNRGVIMDRNGIVLATNYSAYTLEITPSKVTQPLDTLIDQLSTVVEIQGRDRRRFKKLIDESKSFDSVPIRTRLNDEEVARFAAQRYRFAGVEIQARLFRNYPYGELASHVIGYIGRINTSEKAKIEDAEDAANYRGTDYIGKLGVEQSYERELHGITGVHEMETSALEQQSGQARRHGDVGHRHQAAKIGGRPVRKSPWCLGGHRPQNRRGIGLCQQTHLRPQLVCRGH